MSKPKPSMPRNLTSDEALHRIKSLPTYDVKLQIEQMALNQKLVSRGDFVSKVFYAERRCLVRSRRVAVAIFCSGLSFEFPVRQLCTELFQGNGRRRSK